MTKFMNIHAKVKNNGESHCPLSSSHILILSPSFSTHSSLLTEHASIRVLPNDEFLSGLLNKDS